MKIFWTIYLTVMLVNTYMTVQGMMAAYKDYNTDLSDPFIANAHVHASMARFIMAFICCTMWAVWYMNFLN